ncbi:MAG: ammonium transporter [Planctomycetia bacterium]|nr:ammonium transporter [Planctomycetia bacterium]
MPELFLSRPLVIESVFFWERMGVDDVVGAVSVHGTNGLWGLISVGIFANGKYGAGPALPDGKFGKGWNGVVGEQGVAGVLYGDVGRASQRDAQTAWAGRFATRSSRGFPCAFGNHALPAA